VRKSDIGLRISLLLADGKSPQLLLGANNNKEVNSVKKADKPNVVVIVYGDNNKVSFGGNRSHFPVIAITLVVVALAVLTVSQCCPDLLADFVRWIIGNAINS